MPVTDGNGLAERIQMCADRAGNAKVLADLTDISRRTIGTYLSGDSEPTVSRLNRIAAAANVSAGWLANGEGPFELSLDCVLDFAGVLKRADGDQEACTEFDNKMAAIGESYRAAMNNFALVSNIDNDNVMAFRHDYLAARGLSVDGINVMHFNGDSMVPLIDDGAVVLIDTTDKTLTDGYLFVLDIYGKRSIKRFQQGINSINLLSDNKAYEPMVVNNSDMDNIEVIGRVVWAEKDL